MTTVSSLLTARNSDVRINQGDRFLGSTALHWAAEEGHLGMVELLVRLGADLTLRNVLDETPAAAAAKGGHADVVAALARLEEEEGRAARNA